MHLLLDHLAHSRAAAHKPSCTYNLGVPLVYTELQTQLASNQVLWWKKSVENQLRLRTAPSVINFFSFSNSKNSMNTSTKYAVFHGWNWNKTARKVWSGFAWEVKKEGQSYEFVVQLLLLGHKASTSPFLYVQVRYNRVLQNPCNTALDFRAQ